MAEKPGTSGMDLSQLDARAASEAGTVVELEHPVTGQPLTDDEGVITIRILGDDSAKVRAIVRRNYDARMERIQRNRNLDLTLATTEAEVARKLAAATIAWRGIVLDGVALECNEHNAYKLYSDPRFPWLVEQLTKASGDRSRFFRNGSAT
jgi:hypothetical protein